MKIVLIGSGNVATHLGKALKNAGHRIVQVYGRSEPSAKKLAKNLAASYTTKVKDISDKGDLYIIALRDEAIRPFIDSFKLTGKSIVHTSGSVSMKVFEKKVPDCGVLYPVQTFSIAHPVRFKNIPFCIEAGNVATKKKITAVAKTLTENIHFINSEQRKKIHLAAVFANNFSNHLFAIAEDVLLHEHISFELLRPLLMETALKVMKHSPRDMQTGPAKRGDSSIIREHLGMLSSKPRYREIYKLISQSITEMNGVRL